MHRRTSCSPETIKTIIDTISMGLSNRDAAAAAKIAERTFYNWIKRGEQEARRLENSQVARESEAPFLRFLQSYRGAIPRRKQALLARIQRAAHGGEQVVERQDYYENGELVRYEIVTRTLAPDWRAAALLLARLHPEEFGPHRVADTSDWRREVLQMLVEGLITPDEVYEELGDEVAQEFFESTGLGYSRAWERAVSNQARACLSPNVVSPLQQEQGTMLE